MSAARFIIGVDPGSVSGAFAVIALEPTFSTVDEVGDLPVTDKNVNATLLARALAPYVGQAEAVVEAVSAMPKQGVTSVFNFGTGYGTILGVLGALGIPVNRVRPSRWKRAMGLSSDGDLSRRRAIDLYPEAAGYLSRKKDHGRAEAILLAAWQLGRR